MALCDRILNDATKLIAGTAPNSHAKYIQLYKLITSRDKVLGSIFNDWKRSNFYPILTGLVAEKLVSPAELQSYSAQTQEVVSTLLE